MRREVPTAKAWGRDLSVTHSNEKQWSFIKLQLFKWLSLHSNFVLLSPPPPVALFYLYLYSQYVPLLRLQKCSSCSLVGLDASWCPSTFHLSEVQLWRSLSPVISCSHYSEAKEQFSCRSHLTWVIGLCVLGGFCHSYVHLCNSSCSAQEHTFFPFHSVTTCVAFLNLLWLLFSPHLHSVVLLLSIY